MGLREVLEVLMKDAGGALTPEFLVEAVRAEDHPLHGVVFNLPPGPAAEMYYLARAGAAKEDVDGVA